MRIFIRALPLFLFVFAFLIPNSFIRLAVILFASFLTFKGCDILINQFESTNNNKK